MRLLALATLGIASPSLPASAAPQYSWTGFYIGGDVGLRSTKADWATIATLFGPPDFSGENYDSAAARFGAFVGYSWQFAPRWVVGAEADIGWANSSNRQAKWLPGVSGGPAVPVFFDDQSTVRTTWDGSARARFGYLLTPSTLLYGTGGVAWQKLEWSVFCFVCGLGASDEDTRRGWTVGAGVEMAIARSWLLRGEYRYADFGTTHQFMDLGGVPTALFDIRYTTHTFKFGLAYQFNGSGTATMPSWPEPAVSDWGGAYVGAGLGFMASRSKWTGLELAGIPAIFTGDGLPENFNSNALRGTAFAGYNWMLGQMFVAGAEVDVGYTGNTASQPGYAPSFYGPAGIVILPDDVTMVRTTWDAGLRARFGYLVMPNVMVFVTGGLAVQRYTFTSSFICGCGPGEGFAQTSKTYLGPSVGGGVEARLWGSWRGRAEYRYADFGTQRVNLQHPFYAPDPFVSDLRLTTHTGQFSLIYDLN